MSYRYQTPAKALDGLKEEFDSIPQIASLLDVSVSLLYNYYNGHRKKVSPTVVSQLRRGGFIPTRIRSQITWDTQEQKDAFNWFVRSLGTNTSDYCRDVANSNIEPYKQYHSTIDNKEND
jgi:hypothetical protein